MNKWKIYRNVLKEIFNFCRQNGGIFWNNYERFLVLRNNCFPFNVLTF